MQGSTLTTHRDTPSSYISDGDPGRHGAGTLTSQSVEPTLEAYENIFGPSARDIKQDLQRFKRHGRWHLPDILKGPNQYLTDRIDGLITDATNSPFTSRILPYKYITNVDGKIKWNVWSFDEGLSSRVPYEAAARTLQQSKRSFAGYTIRQGMAIVLEHNFMMTDAGRANFKNQLNQLIGSIQLTNDLDVHVALVLAPSYQKTMKEKYLTNDKSSTQICREFVDMFGFVQKNQNALDILIEEAKAQLRTWGAPMPDFMLCNSKLTFQLTMTPEATNYVTHGAEGVKRLRTGPDLPSYRGIGIVHTRAFSMETGAPPRDILRRRVRVAEYARILPHKDNHKRLFQLYNEERDTWSTFTFQDLLQKSLCSPEDVRIDSTLPGARNHAAIHQAVSSLGSAAGTGGAAGGAAAASAQAAGTGLGRHIEIETSGEDALAANLTELYKQIFKKDTLVGFTSDVMFVDKRIVYVPGAIDTSKGDLYDDPKNKMNDYPEFIQKALRGINLDTEEDKENVRMGIQSVALYPRNVATYVEDIQKGSILDDMEWPDSFPQYRDGRGVTPEMKNLRTAMAVRNFNRYGVPKSIVKGNKWGHSTHYIQDALKLNYNTTSRDFTFLDQHLRDRGAFYCPNHYKGNAPTFNNLGDFMGYHLPITKPLALSLTAESDKFRRGGNQTKSWSLTTLLYDIVQSPEETYKDLFTAVATILNDVERNRSQSRMTLTSIIPRLMQTLQENNNVHRVENFDQASKITKEEAFYWLWPRVESSEEEIFSTRNKSLAAKHFQDNLNVLDHGDLTMQLAALHVMNHKDMVENSFPLLASAEVSDRLPRATAKDARNFFHMLAWRMWADQELPLQGVYSVSSGSWPPAHQYLTPKNTYAFRHFGQGVMKFSGPQADWAAETKGVSLSELHTSNATENIEIVIVRPNIEHYMLGIILGQGGESLGSTFWGQTELSCYDDSMHGIWGMSYKYNERAIVINERNLVRMWDIAYDGYVGGKEDSAVLWDATNPRDPNSLASFVQGTMDVTRPYRGPSMMVMAFDHTDARVTEGQMFKDYFRSNWPSPIVFYDRMHPTDSVQLSADFDNIHVVEVDQFRVFNNNLYKNSYLPYMKKMPDFHDLHTIRKNAGLAASENEASSEALAFQGSLRTLNAENGGLIQEIQGSGHHGPDFIGCASLRAGKGYKINSQPTIQRLV